MRIIFFLFLTAVAYSGSAQPGGGGGLQILHVAYWDGNNTISLANAALKLKFYTLSSQKNNRKAAAYKQASISDYPVTRLSKESIYLPPYIDYTTNKRSERVFMPDQRLELIYKKDTMVIDFMDIMLRSGSGITDVMDTLTMYPGRRMISYRSPGKRLPELFSKSPILTDYNERQAMDTIRKALLRGITNTTLPVLCRYDLVKDEGYLQKVVFVRQDGYDTVLLPHAPVNNLYVDALSFSDDEPGIAPEINIDTGKDPILSGNEPLYKFLFNYNLCPDRMVLRLGEKQKKEEPDSIIKAGYFFKQIEKASLTVNGQKYTGTLKIVYPCTGFDLGIRKYSTYGLIVCKYENGRLMSRTGAGDIDIISELQLARPT